MFYFPQWLAKGCIPLALLTTAISSPARAGAWPQPVGTTEAIVSLTHSLAHRQYDASGNAVSRGRFRKIETQLYVEHGLSERITMIGKVARSTDQTEAQGLHFTEGAFRRIDVGARTYLFTWKETLYSLDTVLGLTTASQGDDPAASQSGDLDYEIGFTTGAPTSFLGLEGFTENKITYRHRPGPRPSEARVDVTLGIKFGDAWMTMLKSNTENSIGRTPSPLGHFWSSKGEFSVVHQLQPGFSIEAAAFRTFLGRNVLQETGLKVAFWYKF